MISPDYEKNKKMKVKLSFNFHDFCNGISKVGNLVFYRFAHFKFFKHRIFNDYFCNTFAVGFCNVCFAVEFEDYLFAYECFFTFQSGCYNQFLGGL